MPATPRLNLAKSSGINVTKYGLPVAKLVPVDDELTSRFIFGYLQGTVALVGDLVSLEVCLIL